MPTWQLEGEAQEGTTGAGKGPSSIYRVITFEPFLYREALGSCECPWKADGGPQLALGALWSRRDQPKPLAELQCREARRPPGRDAAGRFQP